MNKEFVPYEQALELKELGFDDYNIAWYIIIDEKPQLTFQNYSNHLCAPLYQQAFRWFREKYDLIEVITKVSSIVNYTFVAVFYKGNDNHFIGSYNTYEEAELACLKKLIEIAKQI